jgi:hypothetical protein
MATVVSAILTIDPPNASGEVRAVISGHYNFTQKELDLGLQYSIAILIVKYLPGAVIISHPSGFDANSSSSIPFDPNWLVGSGRDAITPNSTSFGHVSEVWFSEGNVVPPEAPLTANVRIIPEVCEDRTFTRPSSVPSGNDTKRPAVR